MYLFFDFFNFCFYLVVKMFLKLRVCNGLFLEDYFGDNYLGYIIDGYIGICYFRLNLWNGENILY